MKRIVAAVPLLAGLLVTIPALAGEPLVVDLWPGKAAGRRRHQRRRRPAGSITRRSSGPTKLITNVTKPTLTIYRPAPEKNTGTAMLICPGGGYWDLYWELEGEEVAAWLNSLGHDRHHPQVPLPAAPRRRPGRAAPGPAARRPAGRQPGPQPGRGVGHRPASGSAWSASRPAATSRWRPPPTSTSGCTTRSTPSTRSSCRPDFAVLCYSGYLKAKDKDELRPGPPHPGRHAADLPGPRLRRQRELRRLRRGEQRVHVPGPEARRRPGRAAHLRDRRPRLRRAPEREAPLELDAALRQLAPQPASLDVQHGQVIAGPRAEVLAG